VGTNYEDVVAFHKKFGLPTPAKPKDLDEETFFYRSDFIQEELDELNDAYANLDEAGIIDALVDIVYVAMGTAVFMGFDWQRHWDEVQRANMCKVRAASAEGTPRNNAFDVVKPEGWVGPQHEKILHDE
jgi:predicted HAD superfamily Cof-like phosphohydrolase